MPNDALARSHVSLASYARHVAQTNKLTDNALDYALLGIFGEVGSLMGAGKKRAREGSAYTWFEKDACEEFGDTLWYFALVCNLESISIETLFRNAVQGDTYASSVVSTGEVGAPVAVVSSRATEPSFVDSMVRLGQAASALFEIRAQAVDVRGALASFLEAYLDALQASQLSLSAVIQGNMAKSGSRFLPSDPITLPDFDCAFHPDERLPDEFAIEIAKRPDGRAVLKCNGVFIGDPLSDNIGVEDAYRYHDVFHLAHAAVLGWSPVFRALIKHKRKSQPQVDEAQDGGRAIVIEEGLTAWIFARSKDYDYFQGVDRLPYDMLKITQQFVDGYEVSGCPLWLWEDAILKGYEVFRKVRLHGGGIVTGNRTTRSLGYSPPG